MEFLNINDFIEQSKTTPVVDVRSPSEFLQGHIPGAVNIPLFTDEERAEVGTRYKKINPESAVMHGLEVVGPKMVEYVKQAKKIAKKNNLLVHCWRGGMRSKSLAFLFEVAGIKCSVLTGGYKSFRRHVLESFQMPLNLLVLGGYTGSGKTDILHEINQSGEQIIDLEKLANHKGSAFGSLGMPPQPTNEQFENNLFDCINKLDLNEHIWVEDESECIGKIVLPKAFYLRMFKSQLLVIDMPREMRTQRLLKDYGSFSKEELSNSFLRISKKLGNLVTRICLDSVKRDELNTAINFALKYYDKMYDFSTAETNESRFQRISLDNINAKENAQIILKYVDDYIRL